MAKPTNADANPRADDLASPVKGFLLHVFHRLVRGRTIMYAMGRLETGQTFGIVDDRFVPRFYVRSSDAGAAGAQAQPLGASVHETSWTTMDREPVAEVRAAATRTLRQLADGLAGKGVRTYEADVTPRVRYLMDHDLRGAALIAGPWQPGTDVDRVCINPQLAPADLDPDLAVLALDIETNPDATELYAISFVGTGPQDRHTTEEIHLVGPSRGDDPDNVTCYLGERELLVGLAERIRQIDPDVLTGWNLVDFDLPVLHRRFGAHGLEFNLGRTRDASWYREGQTWGSSRMVVYGRQVLDTLHLVRSTLQRYEDYRLGTVAQAILGRGKTLHADEGEDMPDAISRAYREDRRAFCDYCLEDSRLVRDILQAEGLIPLSLRRSMLTGLPFERAWGSIAAFEFLYMGQLHKRGIVAPTRGVDRPTGVAAPGGLVILPKDGVYRNVFVFDFRSLYPSIIRTFNIDPLSHVRACQTLIQHGQDADVITAPNQAVFDREPGILPRMLEGFFERRARAKEEGDALASFTYKIIMNSFYGVLGTEGCRFASGQLAGAITEFGHHLLRWTQGWLEGRGLKVLYGDTDSLFVDPGLPGDTDPAAAEQRAQELCREANVALAEHVRSEHGVESHLELEFEKVYRRFLLPPMRGRSDRGRAKGYAGLRVDAKGEQLEIVGMEAVRRDWTRLAHSLQRDLLWLLFHDTPPGDMEARVRDWIRGLRSGERDDDLVYHKSLRKPVSQYTRTTPPHVKAAKLLPKPSGVIHYVVTADGPQPLGHVTARLDYGHYIHKQIEPIVRTIGQVYPLDVAGCLSTEPGLFDGLSSGGPSG